MTRLLERDADLAALRAAAVAASEGRGSVVTITGEAGIGKSSLVRVWSDDPGAECRVLVGLCDDLLTRRTLGPLHDIARRTGGPWLTQWRGPTPRRCERRCWWN